jgi:hypothetical protein
VEAIAFGWMLLFAFSPTIETAADVDYQLDMTSLTLGDSPPFDEVRPIEFEERVWSAPGIEQTSQELLPPKKFDFQAPKQLRIEAADGYRGGTGYLISGGPEWVDDAAWPLTRELYGLGRPLYEGDTRTVFTFGGIGLQR